MADRFTFELVTPERVLVSMPVDRVLVPGSDGDMTVLAGHAPVISTLRPGVIEVGGADGKTTRVYVAGGFCEITPDGMTVLAEKANDVEAMGAGAIAAEVAAAEAALAAATDDEARWRATTAIERLKGLSARAA